jgi:hypothetical protein
MRFRGGAVGHCEMEPANEEFLKEQVQLEPEDMADSNNVEEEPDSDSENEGEKEIIKTSYESYDSDSGDDGSGFDDEE